VDVLAEATLDLRLDHALQVMQHPDQLIAFAREA
jgi:hypothetical protein